MDDKYFLHHVQRVDFKVHNPHGRKEFCAEDVMSWAEDERGVTLVNALPIDDIQRGSVCDLVVWAAARSVYDGSGLEPRTWAWHDLLCVGVEHNREHDRHIKVTYRFIK